LVLHVRERRRTRPKPDFKMEQEGAPVLLTRSVGFAEVRAAAPTNSFPAASSPADCAALWERLGLVVLVAQDGGEQQGLALAASHPGQVHVICVDGAPRACRLLLDQLVRLAGERDVSMWCPAEQTAVGAILEEKGFVLLCQDESQCPPSSLYRLRRALR
jgi:pimeloyl-ACP methyl ester carboxylesterase